ncbi:hypothetical protein ASPSYDRAFT_62883 [Aspergillus sydowii CBS 593.65]|uniref:Uncharacterized protein n=1 Tax=Aspergillus sydowii CBS 593.65 TaxID=1036612 RepID=A0A1L9SZ68_9EURO|nr:uncharacterized protein ASPSYDRAFT_62883 [Aspergillus sydowii CBS 593.65]OJJ52371.1 hypothetical protein ASPSYDRAFT_62883 [Aspergillus sydowii CBS 593.65]
MASLPALLSPRWRWCLCIAPVSLLLLFLYQSGQFSTPTAIPGTLATPVSDSQDPQSLSVNSSWSLSNPVGARNSTLGFEAILALSPYSSWRTRGLQAAANATGLDIQIPPQPPIATDIVTAFASLGSEDRAHPNSGSAQAWIAHLKLIEHIIQSDLESALSVYINDTTVCPAESYTGSIQSINSLPERHRVVFYSQMPICSFAYALSRQGARNVLLDIGTGNDEAFDIALMNGCRERGLNCITVFPELFHHYKPSEKLGSTSLVNSHDNDSNKVEIELEMGQTENIMDSARCKALWGKPCLPQKPAED